jgi:hypothetical protein
MRFALLPVFSQTSALQTTFLKYFVFDTERLKECQGERPAEIVSGLDATDQFV